MTDKSQLQPNAKPDVQKMIALLKTWDYDEDPLGEQLRLSDEVHFVNILYQIITSGDSMKYYAAQALIRLNPQQGLDLLLPLLDNSQTDEEMRYQICGLMSDFGDKRAIEPVLRRLLHDPVGNVRAVAAFALGKLGDKKILPDLRWVQEHDQGTDFQGTPMSLITQEAIDEILNRRPAA